MKNQISYYIILCLFIVFTNQSKGQLNSDKLRIGDRVPDELLEKLFSHKENKDNSPNDKKTSLILIEFWSINCSACIAGMPKLQMLQDDFSDNIKIFMVTKNSAEEISKLRERNSNVRNCTLPMINGDKSITDYFTYQTVPVFAWINQNGILTHFSSNTDFLNNIGIQDYLNGEKLVMEVKKEYGDFDRMVPLLIEGGGRVLERTKAYSFFTDRIDIDKAYTYPPLHDPESGQINGLRLVNQSMVNMYLYAYADSISPFGFSRTEFRVVLPTIDSNLYSDYENDPERRYMDQYCYESRLPNHLSEFLIPNLQQDLKQFFGYQGKMEKRKADCLVLKRVDSELPLILKGKNDKKLLKIPYDADSLIVKGSNFMYFTYAIAEIYRNRKQNDPILIDESGIKRGEKINIEIIGNLKDLIFFRKALRRYGLDLVPEERWVEYLVLTKQ